MTDLTNHASLQEFEPHGSSSFSRDAVSRLGASIPRLAGNAVVAVQSESYARQGNMVLKRMIDIVAASIALLVLAPFLLIIVLLIRLESPGSAIFVQERWGLGRRKIRVYKFRSMYADKCDISGVAQTVPGDPRVTRLGQFMRRANIDELPQLINVLKGDLSLVGPRCHAIGMRADGVSYEELVPQYHCRHLMRPGITGLAQLNGYRGPTIEAGPAIKRIAYDLEYVADFNIFRDLKIMFFTLVREMGGGTGF